MTDAPVRDPSAPEVVLSPGRLPRFWNESVVFVANLLGLFFGNERMARRLAGMVGEADSYGGRLVPVLDLLFTGPEGNLLLLEREADLALCRYLQDVVGLSLPAQVVLPHEDYLEVGAALASEAPPDHPAVIRLIEHPCARMDGYVTDDILARLAAHTGKRTLSTPEGSQRGNNKFLLHQHLVETGLPVVPTEFAEAPEEVDACLRRLEEAGFSAAVVKAPIGASGVGLIKVPPRAERRSTPVAVPAHFFLQGPCLVQGWLQPGEGDVRDLRSPSAQLFVDEHTVQVYDLTEQFLSLSSVHEGNESPPRYLKSRPDLREEILRQAGVAGMWLHRQGYRGTASADFLVTERVGRSTQVYVCELNARVTGATYPSVLARHLQPGCMWLMRNLRFREPIPGRDLLARLRGSCDLYMVGEGDAGVLPINFNHGPDGLVHKGQFLCIAPTIEACEALLEKAERTLPCVRDRD